MRSSRTSLVLHSAILVTLAFSGWTNQTRAANITAVVDSPSNVQIKLNPIANIGLTPIDGSTIPGDSKLYVGTTSPGTARILVVDPTTKTVSATPFLQFSATSVPITGQGLQGMTFSPNYTNSSSAGYHKLYTYEEETTPSNPSANVMYLHPEVPNPADVGVLREWTANASGTAIDTSVPSRVVFNFGTPAGHMGGGLKFGPDGMLYLTTGDGGGNGNGNSTTATNDGFTGRDTGGTSADVAGISNGQDFTNALGKIIRIDPYVTVGSSTTTRATPSGEVAKTLPGAANPSYFIPTNNPFYNNPQGIFFANQGTGSPAAPPIPELYAFGFRNPWKLSFDKLAVPGDGPYVSDVGSHAREEIDLIQGGNNYGWPYREGDETAPEAAPGRPITNNLIPFQTSTGAFVQYTAIPALVDVTKMSGPTAILGTRSGTGSPLTFQDHTIGDTGDGDAIVGGFIYRGTLIPQLYGKYIMGVYEYLITDTTRAANTFPAVSSGGRLLYFDPNEASDIKTVMEFNYDSGFGISNAVANPNGDLMSIIQDNNGELYGMFANGDIKELLPSAVPEPASLALLGTSALLLLKRRRRH